MRCEYAQQKENNESRPQLGYIVDSEKYPQEGLQMQEWAEMMDWEAVSGILTFIALFTELIRAYNEFT